MSIIFGPERPPMNEKRGGEIAVGDVLVFLGTPHRITSIEPYTGPLAHLWNGKARIARAGTWGATLDPHEMWEVL